MSNADSQVFSFQPDRVRLAGNGFLYTALAFGLALLLGVAVVDTSLLLLFPLFLIAIPAFAGTLTNPTYGLFVALAAAPMVMRIEEGIQIGEAVYGLYFIGFLVVWFLQYTFSKRRDLLTNSEDHAALLFFVVISAWIPLTFVFGGDPRAALSEWIALLIFGLYFPIREFCSTHPRAPRIILGLLLWLCFFAAADKLLAYTLAVRDATQAWQIISNRVTTIEAYLLVPTLFALVFFAFEEGRRKYSYLVGFLFFFSMLLLTQSRGYWIDFVFGSAFLFLVGTMRARRRMLRLFVIASAAGVFISFVAFRDLFVLFAAGIVDRFVSLGSAFDEDLSLINRFRESAAVLKLIFKNPVIGYGLGVEFQFYDITLNVTRATTFIHNGILSLWYRFGILGLGAITFLWYRSVRSGLQLFGGAANEKIVRLIGLSAAVSLVALIPSVNTSNPFFILPEVLMFTILFGTVAGLNVASSRPVIDRTGQ